MLNNTILQIREGQLQWNAEYNAKYNAKNKIDKFNKSSKNEEQSSSYVDTNC